jgi:hypothetical protein
MNKYQEALKFLGEYSLGCAITNHKDDTIKVINDYRQTLQELVDKATPKKTIKSKNPLFDYMVFCPACNKSVSFKNYYCGSCGQALDWSDEYD